MVKYYLLLFIFSLNISLFPQVISINKIIFDEDFVLHTTDDKLIISSDGNITYKNFTHSLYDFSKIPLYQAGDYIGFVYREFLFASMAIDTGNGGMLSEIFVDYINNDIIFLRDIGDKPKGLKSVIGYDDVIVFLYVSQAICYDLNTREILWIDIWNKLEDDKKIDYSLFMKSYFVDKDGIIINLQNDSLKLNYQKGRIKQ